MDQTVKTSKKGLATQERIFAAAIKLINEKGYVQTTVVDICAEAGIAVGTFYHHFNSKQDILLGVVKQENQELTEFYASLDKTSYSTVLLNIMEFQIGYILRKGPVFLSQLVFSGLQTAGTSQSLSEFSLNGIIYDCICCGQKNGEFSCDIPTSVACDMLLGLYLFYMQNWCVQGEQYNIKEKLLYAYYSFVRMIAVR